MKPFLIILTFFLLQNCTKPKSVLICGDHVCVNKAEAEQFFEENLTIEVKIIDKKNKKKIDLVELNLKDNLDKNRKIIIEKKDKTKKEVKILSNKEIKEIKSQIKENKINKKISVKKEKQDVLKENKKIAKSIVDKKIKKKDNVFNQTNNSLEDKEVKKLELNDKKQRKKVVDVCTIIEECSIDEISKYLLKQGKKKNFPIIATKE